MPGFLVNQWALDEHDGLLRVASTGAPVWWTSPDRRESESFVTVLAERDGKLVPVGRVGSLGKANAPRSPFAVDGRLTSA